MVIDPAIERTEPGPGSHGDDSQADAILQAEANASVERWLQDHPGVGGELKGTVRARTHLREIAGRKREAEQAQGTAEHRHSMLLTRRDSAGQRILGFTVGVPLVVLPVVLDSIPLNWAAQAFGLDAGSTWLVIAISAGLVLGGSAVLARIRWLGLARSSAAAQSTRRAVADARAAQAVAAQKLQRHIRALWQMLLPWALGTAAPASIDRAKWAVALRQSVRQLFPVS